MTEQTDEPEVEPTEATEQEPPEVEPTEELEPTEQEPETFPREVVELLRRERRRDRGRAKDRDDLAQRLHTALVAANGRLADPTDLEFADDHLADEDALTAAVDDLLTRKPHLASRKARGDVGRDQFDKSSGVERAGNPEEPSVSTDPARGTSGLQIRQSLGESCVALPLVLGGS